MKFQKKSALLRDNFPSVRLHGYNQTHPYPKFNGYKGNGEEMFK